VDDREGLGPNRAGAPECVERQLGSLPQKVQSSRYSKVGAKGSKPVGVPRRVLAGTHNATLRNRKALPMTLTEDSAIAAAAMMGESRTPRNG